MQIKTWWPLLFVTAIIIACILIFPSDLRLADLLGKSGKYDEAIQQYEMFLKEDPLRKDIRIQLSKLHAVRGDFKKAVAQLEKVGSEVISDIHLLDQMADIYSHLGDKEKTVATLEKIVLLAPEDLRNKEKLAEAYEWNSDIPNAIEVHEELLTSKPNDIGVLNKLISLNLNQKNFAKSKTYLTTLLEIQPQNQKARILLGDVYIELDQKEFAAVEFERALMAEPENDALREKLADLYAWMQNYQRAIAHYEYLTLNNILNDDYFDELIALTENRDPSKAIKYFNFRLKYLPEDNDLRERLFDLYIHLGFTDEAVEQMQILAENNPEQPQYLEDLAYLYQDILEPDLAEETFEKLIDKGFYSRDVFDELSVYYKNQKEYKKLLELYSLFSVKDELDPENLQGYAETLALSKQYDQAIVQYSNLLQSNPEDAANRIQLAELYLHTGQDKRAVQLIKNGVDKYHFENEEYLFYAAQFFDKQKYYKESISTYEMLTALYKDNFLYKERLISLYTKTKNFRKASILYDELIQKQPNDIDLKFEYASLHWLQNDLDAMHRLMDGINKLHSDEVDIHKRSAKFYFERGFYNEAIEHLLTDLASSPEDSLSMQMLGLAYAWNNQPGKSKTALQKYHELYPADYYTHYHLGVLLMGEGNKKAALNEFQISQRLLESRPESKQSQTVLANIYAYQNEPERALDKYEALIAKYPDDISVLLDYAEGLIILKKYRQSDNLLNEILEKEPNSYRALRLQARSFFERGKYKKTAETLNYLSRLYPNDLNLSLDLSDSELAAGDWVNSTRTLKDVLKRYPHYYPAQQRLMQLRREQSEAFAADYQYQQQSDNFLRQVANLVFTKAKSSLLSLKFLLGEEKYSTKNDVFGDQTYLNLGLGASSSLNSKFQSSFLGKAQRKDDDWHFTGHGHLRWKFSPSNSFVFESDFNELWNDPLLAAFFEGRLHRLQSDLNLTLLNNIIIWNRFSYERHAINNDEHFGNAIRSYAQLGYQWRFRPQLLTYYQFYNLRYSYKNEANRAIIAIPENEAIHYFGAALNQQLTKRFYYQLGGSLGLNTSQNTTLYYGMVHLEYNLLKNVRLRSLFTFGSQNTLTGKEDDKTVSVDFYYFY